MIDALVEHFLHAALVHGLAGFVGKALTIGGLVMHDGDLLALHVLEDIGRRHRALLVVAAAGAEHVPHAALGHARIGGGRRDREDAVFLIDFGRRHGDAGIEVTDHELHALGRELVGDRHALFGIADVVADRGGDLLALDAAGRVDVFDRLFEAVLQLRAEGGIRSGQRAGDAELDLRRGIARQRYGKPERQSQRRAERGDPFHSKLPW